MGGSSPSGQTDNVGFRHSPRLEDSLFKGGKDFAMLSLPTLTHVAPDPMIAENLHLRIVAFFHQHWGQPS
jgi:dipeptidyl aminopeptidase/acylaminoacyl peptidase